MTENQWGLFYSLANLYINSEISHCCSDFELPNTSENQDMLFAMEAYNTPNKTEWRWQTIDELIEEFEGSETLDTADFYLFGYLVDMVGKELGFIE